jgi:integrase
MSKLIRKTWPKIRVVSIKGQAFYRVDARKTGTNGRQESFKSQRDAEQRAAEIAANFNSNGSEGLSFPVELRGMALAAEKRLRPYGKTLLQAAEFYAVHLDAEKQRKDSAMVPALAQQWYEHKKSGKTKQLRAATLKGIQETAETLKRLFAGKRVLEVTTTEINNHLDSLNVGLRRKFNVCSRLSQFFNWCIARGHAAANPCEKIDIHVNGKDDVVIFSPAEALRLMTICRETPEFQELVLYHVISLFAGLRPSECQLLKWENVHLEEKTITVLAATSKTKESRNVPIEANLLVWLEAYAPEKPHGLVTPQPNLIQRLQAFHAALGYRVGNKNQDASTWPQDVMRHSYGSYWLARYKQRAVLAEHMGNSLQIIKKHYRQVVSKSAAIDYWRITPTYDGSGEIYQQPSDEEVACNRGKRLAAALAKD